MNHSVKNISENVVPSFAIKKKRYREPYLIVLAMFVYVVLLYGKIAEQASTGLVMVISSITYFLAIYLYYGIAWLAYRKHTYLLWGSGTVMFVIGYLMSGLSDVWLLLMGWSMILFAGVIVGRLTLSKQNQQKIYLLSMLAVIVFAIGLFSPLWGDLTKAATLSGTAMLEDARQNLLTMGYGADAIGKSLENASKTLDVLIRLIPAMTVLNMVLQFSIGYIIFVYQMNKKGWLDKPLAPFIYWKVPFGVMPVLIVAILIRISGSETMVHIADNIIAFLAIFYSISGLALMEFYLRKFNLSRLMKIFFYIMLFLTQLIGFFVAMLLGFVDSFADWRKAQHLSLVKE